MEMEATTSVSTRSKLRKSAYNTGISDCHPPSQFASLTNKSLSSMSTDLNSFSYDNGSTTTLVHGPKGGPSRVEREDKLDKQLSNNSTSSYTSTLTTTDTMMEENRDNGFLKESLSEPVYDTMSLERTNKIALHPIQSRQDVNNSLLIDRSRRNNPSVQQSQRLYSLPDMKDISFSDEKIASVLKHLDEQKINFLAIDFDQTMVDIHTGGRWPGKAKDLATRLRPSFLKLIPMAIDRDFYVAVVTFSPQTRMIAEVLHHAFPNHIDRICIRGSDGTWRYNGAGSAEGKQAHMASAVEELRRRFEADITRATTLLIDDDTSNIKTALDEGVRAVWLDPDNADLLPENLLGVREKP